MKKALLLFGIFALTAAIPAQSVQRTATLFSISGQVVDANGGPVPDAHVTASPDSLSGRAPTATTDKDGKFVLDAYKGGRWTVTAEKLADGYPSTYYPFFYPDADYRPEVLLDDKTPEASVTVQLPARVGFLKFHITDESSKKSLAGDVRIRLCRTEAPNYCYSVDRTGASSPQPIPASRSQFTVTISADGFNDWSGLSAKGVATGETEEIAVSMARPKADDAEILPAPEIVSPKDGSELFGIPRTVRVEWAPVTLAMAYGLEVDGCDQDQWKQPYCRSGHPLQHYRIQPTNGIVGTTYEFNYIGAQPGRWRVWAIDSEGRPGKRSAWQIFLFRH